jgi:putative intracellular protease/amidase
MKILMVLTSHDRLGTTGERTGIWLEEFAAPYFAFVDADARVTLASPLGGRTPIDPRSRLPEAATDATRRFDEDERAKRALEHAQTLCLMDADDFDAVFYPGGHGPLWDLVDDADSIQLIEAALAAGKPVAAVCHAPAVLRHVRTADGVPWVHGRNVTGFSNSEEQAAGFAHVVPFLVEDMLRTGGARYSKLADWQPYIVTDGVLITGQNPASAAPAAQALLTMLRERVTPERREGAAGSVPPPHPADLR